MKAFYELMVSLARYELAIAKKYSSNWGYLERNVTAREKALSQYATHLNSQIAWACQDSVSVKSLVVS